MDHFIATFVLIVNGGCGWVALYSMRTMPGSVCFHITYVLRDFVSDSNVF